MLYSILYAFVKLHALLPMRVLYVLSDILCFVVHRIVGYRVKVVRNNLRNAFPDKTEAERLSIERAFYRNFADYAVETLKLAHISEEELQRRALLRNPELVDRLQSEGHTCLILTMGHCFNWEWFSGSASCWAESSTYQIYRPLNSKAFDRLLIELRTRFGSSGLRMNDTMRKMVSLKRSGERSVVIFLADQSPNRDSIHHWSNFMNQETGFFSGPERLAKKLDIPVLFLRMKHPARGQYMVDIELLTDTPMETSEGWITEQYVRKMDESLRADPANWLWSHKRWKHTKQSVAAWRESL